MQTALAGHDPLFKLCRGRKKREQGAIPQSRPATKPIQTKPNKSKHSCLDLFGFIRQNREFSMNYFDSK